jgi:hypothetical protein
MGPMGGKILISRAGSKMGAAAAGAIMGSRARGFSRRRMGPPLGSGGGGFFGPPLARARKKSRGRLVFRANIGLAAAAGFSLIYIL